MIRVQELSKKYGSQVAVNSISFQVNKGEIVGFLGPNGAGKSTTLKMLTCFLTPTSGKATVAGYDIYKNSIDVRKNIGYMSENVPLYHDMKVREYLLFRSLIKDIRFKDSKKAVNEAMDKCNLSMVSNNMISTLSKGYRQRVSLADAILGNPKLLILDEPTNGLDPNQIRNTRNLIKNLGQSHTILISTHILSEVEIICDRVIIIDKGKIRASDSPNNLIEHLHKEGELYLEFKGPYNKVLKEINNIEEVLEVKKIDNKNSDSWNRLIIHTKSGFDVREKVFNIVSSNKSTVRELGRKMLSLEDAFVSLTKDKK